MLTYSKLCRRKRTIEVYYRTHFTPHSLIHSNSDPILNYDNMSKKQEKIPFFAMPL